MTTDTVKVEIVRDEKGVKIVEYNATQTALAALEKKHKGMLFEVAAPTGMKDAKAARRELRELRVNLEKRRQELKAPILEYTRALDGQAKEITARIAALEDPIDQQIKTEEARKAREKAEAEAAERARIDAHRRVIEDMRNMPLVMIGKPAVEIEGEFHALQRQDLSGLEEFQTEAALVKDEAAGKLHELWTQAMEREEAAKREAEARRQREEQEAEEKAAREAERAELEELRAFKAKQEAAEDATRVPPEMLGAEEASGPDASVAQVVAAEEAEFVVHVDWSGYSRGFSTYRVQAASAEEAMERWNDGELIKRIVVRDDTEKEPACALVRKVSEGGVA